MSSKLEFPVFCFEKKNNMIYVFFKEKELKSTNTEILKTFDKRGIKIIDSNGDIFILKRAFFVRYIGFFGFSLLKKGRQVLMDFEIENISKTSLDEFKKLVIDKINMNKKYWSSNLNITELETEIVKCNSFPEVANILK
jgi:hypothetical protein